MKSNKSMFILIFSIIIVIFSSANSISLIEGNNQKSNYSLNNFRSNFYTMSNNSLLAYWNLDEGSGIIAHDGSGHGLDGIIHGPTWTDGYLGHGLNFDGDLDYIILDDYSDELGFNKTDHYKFSAWIKTASNPSGTLYMISDNSDPIPVFYIKLENNGTIEMKVQSTESCQIVIQSEKKYNDSKWHYIEGIFHGSEGYPEIELYVDNNFSASGSDWLCPLINNQFSAVKIGMASYDNLYMYKGIIDEIKTYKRPDGNQPPNKPEISGPTTGTIHETYNYSFLISDPEDDQSYLWIDWGDKNNTGWLGPYNSGDNIILNHSWSNNGVYNITAKLKDTFDIGEVDTLIVAMGNIAPSKPTIEGPLTGSKGYQLEYSLTSKDLNDHDIKYNIDWGDGSTAEWTEFHPSDEKVSLKHAFSHQGVYFIKANAVDIYNEESGWSKSFIVNITEKAFLIGLITNFNSDENFIYFNAKLLYYIGLKPIKTNFYINEEKLLVTYDYNGNLNNKFIFGIFNSAII